MIDYRIFVGLYLFKI